MYERNPFSLKMKRLCEFDMDESKYYIYHTTDAFGFDFQSERNRNINTANWIEMVDCRCKMKNMLKIRKSDVSDILNEYKNVRQFTHTYFISIDAFNSNATECLHLEGIKTPHRLTFAFHQNAVLKIISIPENDENKRRMKMLCTWFNT